MKETWDEYIIGYDHDKSFQIQVYLIILFNYVDWILWPILLTKLNKFS